MPGFEKTPTNDNIPIEQFPRVYDMNSPVPVAEYVDAHTNVRLIVKGDVLGTCTYELSWDEGDESYNQEIHEAIRRLLTRAGIIPGVSEQPAPIQKCIECGSPFVVTTADGPKCRSCADGL